MWKISVLEEHRTYMFTDKFVEELLLWAFRNRGLCKHDEILKTRMSKQLRALVNNKKYKDNFKNCMLDLSCCKRIGSVLQSFKIYTSQYHQILKGKVKPPKLLCEETMQDIESTFEYLYKSLLNSKFFWEIYNPNGVYKTRQEVRAEQGKHKVCPYCDQNYITSNRKSNMDHFLPISQFPFLSIHWANLIVACSTCNGILIKDKNWYIPILHPYFDPIEEVLYFSFNRSDRLIKVKARTGFSNFGKWKIRGENMITLLKHTESYEGLWIEVEDEQNRLEDKVKECYREYKDSLLSDSTVLEILKCAVGVREMDLLKVKRQKAYTKLKWDYGKEYVQHEGKEYIEFLRNEQQEMFSQRIEG
ncbi:hypothetical protein FZC66_08175 [Priestia megaterium]|nr:hypothetical protein FZC66_08175 [Priestia megaterium]